MGARASLSLRLWATVNGHVLVPLVPAPWSMAALVCSCVPVPTGIMLGRMGDSGRPLVNFCQCLNESIMKIVGVAVW